MDAELGLVVAWYGGREEETDPQRRRRAGFLRQETGGSPCTTGSGPPRLRPWHASIMRRSTWHTEPTEYGLG